MNTSDKRKSGSAHHPIRSSTTSSSRNSTIIAQPPRAQLIRPTSTPPNENDLPHEQQQPSSSTGKDSSSQSSHHSKEREIKLLHEKITELRRSIAANEAEFARTLEQITSQRQTSQNEQTENEKETTGYWHARHSELNQRFLRIETENNLLKSLVDLREAEKAELRDKSDLLRHELAARDAENLELRDQIAGLKTWVSASTRRTDQTSDEEFGDAVVRLRNGLQNWVVSHFRKCSFQLNEADPKIIEDLANLVPMYEELAVSETKAAFLQSIVSSILVEMIFDAYFVGLPDEQATRLRQIENYLVELSSAEAVNEWRAMTLTMLQRECASKIQPEADAVTQNVMMRVNRILDNITDAKQVTEVRDQALRALVTNAINLARLLVAQKALFRVTMPKVLPYQRILFEAGTMDHIGEEDEDSLAAREVLCITFPGIIKTGDENGKHLQYRNVIAKATVLCSPE